MSGYHTLLRRVERNPARWTDLAVSAGRDAIGNIVEQGMGKSFVAFAFDQDGAPLGTYSNRKAARHAVYEAYQRQGAIALAS